MTSNPTSTPNGGRDSLCAGWRTLMGSGPGGLLSFGTASLSICVEGAVQRDRLRRDRQTVTFVQLARPLHVIGMWPYPSTRIVGRQAKPEESSERCSHRRRGPHEYRQERALWPTSTPRHLGDTFFGALDDRNDFDPNLLGEGVWGCVSPGARVGRQQPAVSQGPYCTGRWRRDGATDRPEGDRWTS